MTETRSRTSGQRAWQKEGAQTRVRVLNANDDTRADYVPETVDGHHFRILALDARPVITIGRRPLPHQEVHLAAPGTGGESGRQRHRDDRGKQQRKHRYKDVQGN